MEEFSAKIRRLARNEDGTLYMEFEPANAELAEAVMHGMTLPVAGSVAATVEAYEATAAREMRVIVEQMHPGLYVLDAKYN